MLEAALDTVDAVGRELSAAADLREALAAALQALDRGGLRGGVLTLLHPSTRQPLLELVHPPHRRGSCLEAARYAGLVGAPGQVLAPESSGSLLAERVEVGGAVVGVLGCRPDSLNGEDRAERARLLRVVARLVGQRVGLAWQAEGQRETAVPGRGGPPPMGPGPPDGFAGIAGRSEALGQLLLRVCQVAAEPAPVLIRGETGSGKALIARAVHAYSPNAAGPFVTLNCAALPGPLLEWALFGNPSVGRPGALQQASGGTLFLDEIGEALPAGQASLLKALRGGPESPRLVAATNRDLEAAVADGAFSAELYRRLGGPGIRVPTLAERLEDIPAIVSLLLARVGAQLGCALTISDAAVAALARREWPGNVRELENCLVRAAVTCAGGEIGVADVIESAQAPADGVDAPVLDERGRVIAALEQCGWVQAKAARLLRMTPRQVAYRIRTLKIPLKRL